MPYSAQGTVIQAGDGATPEEFTTIGDVTGISGPSLTHEAVDTTNLEDVAKTYLAAGTYDGGEVSIDLNWDADTVTQIALITSARAGTQINYQVCWPNYDGTAKAFLPADVIIAADTITEAAHGLTTGQPIQISTDDTMPPPLVAGTTYYVIWDTANTIQVSTTNANAVAGAFIDITGQGVGNHAIQIGDRFDFTASVSGATPGGSQGDKLTGTITLKVTGAVTP